MSYTISTDVFCDGCGDWDQAVTCTGPAPRKREAWTKAKARGWRRVEGRQLCPECDATHAPGGTDDSE